MYYFEDWLNENQALAPRSKKSKKHDKDQEIDIHEELEDLEKRLIKSKKKKQKLEEKSKCDQCSGQLGSSYFYNKKANDNKKLCSEECYSLYYAENCDKCSKKIKTAEKSYYTDAKKKIGVLCERCWEAKKGGENFPTIPDNSLKPDPGWKYCSVCLVCSQRWNHTRKPRKCSSCKSKNIKIYDVYGQEKTIPKKSTIPYEVWIGGGIFLVIIISLFYSTRESQKKQKH